MKQLMILAALLMFSASAIAQPATPDFEVTIDTLTTTSFTGLLECDVSAWNTHYALISWIGSDNNEYFATWGGSVYTIGGKKYQWFESNPPQGLPSGVTVEGVVVRIYAFGEPEALSEEDYYVQ